MNRSLLLIIFIATSLFADSLGFDMSELNAFTSDSITQGTTQSAVAESVSPIFVLFRIIGSLALLSVVIIGVVGALKKTGIGGKFEQSQDSQLELLDELPTGPGTSVLLVRFGDKVHMLGQGTASLTPIDSVEGEKALEIIAESAGGKSVGTFRANLNKYVMNLPKGGSGGKA